MLYLMSKRNRYLTFINYYSIISRLKMLGNSRICIIPMQSRYTGHFPPPFSSIPPFYISNQHYAQAKEFYTAECTKVAGMEKYLRERGSEMTEDEMHQVRESLFCIIIN